MLGLHTPDPNEAMLISGAKPGKDGAPYRIVTGRRAFVAPFLDNKVNYLTLAMNEAEVTEQCVTRQGITLQVKAVIAFKVANDPESIQNAAERFLSDQNQMTILTGRIFAGHLRSIVGSMTVEEIVTERQKLATQVLDGSQEEMSDLGLLVDSLQIQSIDDGDSGYIKAMAAPHLATIQQAAQIAQAAADQAAAEKRQESDRAQAQYARETAVAQAGYKADTDTAQARAGQAGPLAEAEAQQAVLEKQTELAEKQAELREKQLLSEVVKPAQADAERTRIAADAAARSIEVQAAAAAANDRVGLDRMLIDQLPALVEKAAQGLSRADITVLNGSDGLTEIAAGLVNQGVAIYQAARQSITAQGQTTGERLSR